MKIEKFRIKNYRSIRDSGDCYLSPKITVLAGKNEAGKTSILKALRDFSTERSIEDEAVPINRDDKPEIEVTFVMGREELNELLPYDVSSDVDEEQITVVKKYQEGYDVNEDLERLNPNFRDAKIDTKKQAEDVLDEYKDLFSGIPINSSINKKDTIEKLREAINKVRTADRNGHINSNEADKRIARMREIIKKYEELKNPSKKLAEEIKNKIPEFILFSTYSDKIPNKVHFKNLRDNDFVKDLSSVSDLNIDLLPSNGREQKKREHKKEVNVELNDDYQEFWTQDDTILSIDWDSNNLQFWIEEDGTPYKPEQRSKGKMWHLSFYVKLTAHASKENPPVVLIDDPGLHLHAKAQRDILNKLEDVAESSRIIYTTHSPYLIDSEKLDRVWLVEKDKRDGTEIKKLHAGADEDTLRPVITAIGANTTLGVHTDKENSVVVEGISDYHYLQAFSEITEWDSDLDIIPGTGGDSPVNVGSILFGWGVEPIFLLDDDWQGGENREKLEKDLDIDEERIIQIPADDGDIEDVFTKDDFREYVLQGEEPPEYESSNSEYLKPYRGDKDKVLLAKKFYEKARNEDLELEEQTKQNIQEIFSRLEEVVE